MVHRNGKHSFFKCGLFYFVIAKEIDSSKDQLKEKMEKGTIRAELILLK
jgi:hypothetical protein